MFDKTIYFVSNILLSHKTGLYHCHMWGFVPVNVEQREGCPGPTARGEVGSSGLRGHQSPS